MTEFEKIVVVKTILEHLDDVKEYGVDKDGELYLVRGESDVNLILNNDFLRYQYDIGAYLEDLAQQSGPDTWDRREAYEEGHGPLTAIEVLKPC